MGEGEPWIGARVGPIVTEIGKRPLLAGFFASIWWNLEPTGAGSRFPSLRALSLGKIDPAQAKTARKELEIVKGEFKKFFPSHAVWTDSGEKQIPEDCIVCDTQAENLASFFVTSTGKDLLATLDECCETSEKFKFEVMLETIPGRKPWNIRP